MGAEKLPSGKEWERPRQQEPGAGAPRGLFQGGKKLGQLAKEWADARRWSRLGQLAEERTAGPYEEPDRSMKLPFQAQAYDLRGLGPLPPRGWGPSSQEDHGEASLALQLRGYPEEKKEEEGSANRRPEVGPGPRPGAGWGLPLPHPTLQPPTPPWNPAPPGFGLERPPGRGSLGLGVGGAGSGQRQKSALC